ncbi:MAG: transposase [Planctomycetaceae bacterium]|nr:transposase [Planctomycetaceae bacterium]
MRDVAKIVRAIGGATNRNHTGQCTCKLVEGLAKELGITLQFLPSYSPNLNWMERLWKLVKKKCLDNIYYETFDEFTSGINDYLSRVETDYQSELDALMQLDFQNLKKGQLMTL